MECCGLRLTLWQNHQAGFSFKRESKGNSPKPMTPKNPGNLMPLLRDRGGKSLNQGPFISWGNVALGGGQHPV